MGTPKKKKPSKFVLVYITAKNQKQALHLAKAILKNRLAGCVNVIPKMISSYYWKEKLETSRESILIVKTRSDLTQKIIQFVEKEHSYSIPCILCIPIMDGNPHYLKWLGQGLI